MRINTITVGCLFLLSLVLLFGCGPATKANLKSQKDNKMVWEVEAAVEDVFRGYKDYAQENFAMDFPGGGNMVDRGNFYGSEAELTLKLEGNILTRSAYLHFEMEESEGNTIVQIWYYHRGYKKRAQELKEMFPTTVKKR